MECSRKKILLIALIIAVLAAIGLGAYLINPAVTGSAVGAAGETVQVVNDREYYPTVHSAFSDAQKSIHVALYGAKRYDNLKPENEHDNQLLQDLCDAKARGVDVKVALDEEWGEDSVKAVLFLKQCGVEAKFESESIRTHAKFIVLDGEIVIVGSTNWSTSAIDKNHEANVLIKSISVAKEFEGYFWRIWNGL